MNFIVSAKFFKYNFKISVTLQVHIQ